MARNRVATMGVMDGGEIKLVENKVIKIEVVAKLHHHQKKRWYVGTRP